MAAAYCSKETTGDLKNNLMKLNREIKRMKLSLEINLQGLSLGCPSSFLPVLHASLMLYSLPLANWLTRQGYELYGKSDLRFIEGLYKVLRDVFHYHPRLTKEQFLSVGFAERKVILTTQVLLLSQAKHLQLIGNEAVKSNRKKRRCPASGSHGIIGLDSCVVEPVNVTVVDNRTEKNVSFLSTQTNNRTDQSDVNQPTNRTDQSDVNQPIRTDQSDVNQLTNRTDQSDVNQPSSWCSNRLPISLSYTPPPSPHRQFVQPLTPTSDLQLTPHSTPLGIRSTVITPPPLTVMASDVTEFESGGVSTETEINTGRVTIEPEMGDDKSLGCVQCEGTSLIENQSPLMDISSRIDDLAKLVESMSARFVLVENQMKMVDSQHPSQHHPPPISDQHPPDQHNCDSSQPPESSAALLHYSFKDSIQSSNETVKDQLPPLTNHRTPCNTSTAQVPHSISQTTPCQTRPRPLSSHQTTCTPCQTRPHPLSVHQTPSTPDDARRLIDNLRSRAKRTRDFLQQANYGH